MSEPKKVSFGFKSTKKLVAIQKPVGEPKKVDLIDCLEGKSIRIKNEVKTAKAAPLVIPVRDSGKNLLDRVRDANDLKERSRKKADVAEDDRPDSELTLDELAARQLIREAKNFETKPNAAKVQVLPALEDKLLLEGSVEPTLEDYENVPIGDYGMAMLRGMGWSATSGIGKNSKTSAATPAPEMRPKGMGLGAGRLMVQDKTKPATDKDGKELTLHKGVYARIVAGKLKGNYCIVQGLDDEAGRVIVKTTLMGTVLSLNEFLLTPVTKEEYIRSAKVLNNAKYEEYKNQEARKDDVARQNGKIKPEKDCGKPSRNTPEYEVQKKASGSKQKSVDEDSSKKKNGDSKRKNLRRRPSSSESEDVVEIRRSSSKRRGDDDRKKKRDSSDSSSRSRGREYRSSSREYKEKKRKKSKRKSRRRSSSSSSESEHDSRRRDRYRRSSSRSSYDRSSSDGDRYRKRRRSSSHSDRRRSRSRRRSYTRSSRSRSSDSDRRRRRYSSDSYSD